MKVVVAVVVRVVDGVVVVVVAVEVGVVVKESLSRQGFISRLVMILISKKTFSLRIEFLNIIMHQTLFYYVKVL